jgi:hypothetical protein
MAGLSSSFSFYFPPSIGVTTMPKTSLPLIKQCLALLIFASPLLSCGCSGGGGSGPTDIVRGKCMMNGQPVSGDVIFVSTAADKKEYKTTIALNGDYSIPKPSKGEYMVLVKGMGMGVVPGGDKNKKTDPSGGAGTLKGVEPPAKYAKPDNGLPKVDYTKGGELKHDIELTP